MILLRLTWMLHVRTEGRRADDFDLNVRRPVVRVGLYAKGTRGNWILNGEVGSAIPLAETSHYLLTFHAPPALCSASE